MKKIIKKTSDSAVVGMVSAILIIGLIVAVISIIQVIYVPVIMEQREAEHMDKVTEQFGSLTSIIDSQASNRIKGVPIATFVTLGNKELPFLVSSKAFGTLEILNNSCTVTISHTPINSTTETSIFPIGTITYSSTNAYFLNQNYTYEAGAMIVSQSQGNLMMCLPGFFVNFNSITNTGTISFDVVNISSVGKKTIAGGIGTYPIQTEFYDISINTTYTNVDYITITTPHSNAWSDFINRSLKEADLKYNTQFILTNTGQALKVKFLPSITVEAIFKIIDIRAQIGPGWAE
ncbi:Uncharacterised protein [uncultured archaeon]|nr:Uncharacterised protein [uncultured archaeon]